MPVSRQLTGLIIFFVLLKVGINVLAMGRFGFQRDELLYITLGDHLAWGYKEVPPFIALLGYISRLLFGSSLFATRVFSTVFSGLLVWFAGKLTVELGGGKFAVAVTCLALIFSPAFAASGYLFEPVVFDQFWWVLLVYLLVRYVNTGDNRYLYWVGITVGMGMLTKFSILFFVAALLAGLLFSPYRRILRSRHTFLAMLIALFIFAPNLAWEIVHHFPFITQMKTLRAEQLDHITPSGFITQQLIVNGIAVLLWMSGLALLLFSPVWRKFRFLALAYVFVFLLMLLLRGKNYYMLGAYPMLFAVGAIGLERWITAGHLQARVAVLTMITLPNMVVLPLFMLVLSLQSTMVMFNLAYKNFSFFAFEARWDDHQLHPLSQNYGVMFGWDEMARKVALAYDGLPAAERKRTVIYAGNYGEASSLHFYGRQYHLPEVVSLNSSFSLWAPAKLNAGHIIFVDDRSGRNIKSFAPDTGSYSKLSQVENPLAIEKGTGVYLLAQPRPSFYNRYQQQLAKTRLN